MRPAKPVMGAGPDEVLDRLGRAIPSPPRWLTGTLGLLSMAQIVILAPWLLGADPLDLLGTGSEGHITRDGALSLVVAGAGALSALRPRWAHPSLIIALLALVAQFGAGIAEHPLVSVLDVALLEAVHVPSLIIVAAIALVGRKPPPLGPRLVD